MECSAAKYRKGIMFGVLVGIVWGLDGVLMGRVGQNPLFSDWGFASALGISQMTFQFSPLVTAFFHESFCFFWVALTLIFTKSFKQVFNILLHSKKAAQPHLPLLWALPSA